MGLHDKLFGPPSRDKFARLVADAVRTAGEKVPIRYDREEFRLLTDEQDGQVFNLGNAHVALGAHALHFAAEKVN